MKNQPWYILCLILFLSFLLLSFSCSESEKEPNIQELYQMFLESGSENDASLEPSNNGMSSSEVSSPTQTSSSYLLPNIDLTNWKVTLPVGNPTSVKPPEILDYATNETLKPFFYNDSIDGSLVFYTYPKESTPNSSYSRTELREQMVSGSDHINWTFADGGRMRGELAVPEISQDNQGNNHRTIIMQIHGRLTNEQRDLIGENDNNAPPVLKIYWHDGRIRVKTKIVKDLSDTPEELLHTSAWVDDEGYFMPVTVGHDRFTLEVIVTNGRMEVILNDEYSKVYNDIHIQKWGIFENYFKAGNYLQTREQNAFARVKYYSLEISH